MRVLLVSTYELGHQPLHVASPAAALIRAGNEVRALDLAVEPLDLDDVSWADLVAFSVPMHTAARLARQAAARVRQVAPETPVCFYGLYATVDDGAVHPGRPDVSLAGEYEPALVELVDFLNAGTPVGGLPSTRVSLGRSDPALPARHLLPGLGEYARVVADGDERLSGSVEASHGCSHRCRHCPVPVVYDGRTRAVGVESVLADVDQLRSMGAHHVSFGDPDFLNRPQHARAVVDAVHDAFPDVTFDVTVKVSHILRHGALLPHFGASGCLFAVSAFESASDRTLALLDKGHTVADAVTAVGLLRHAGIEPRPSLLPFTPWTTADDVWALIDLVERTDLIGNVDPVQWSIRLLVPPGSLLLGSGALDGLLGAYDAEHLSWTWRSHDERLELLQQDLSALAEQAGADAWSADHAHEELRRTVAARLGAVPPRRQTAPGLASSIPADRRPRMTEAWFCCAEPTDSQCQAMAGAAIGGGP